uniref:Uncharacterized protein n=1 Tax=Anguilla anguilla TaxID=7936 RepID=A0A0E9SRC2_ANGAN
MREFSIERMVFCPSSGVPETSLC